MSIRKKISGEESTFVDLGGGYLRGHWLDVDDNHHYVAVDATEEVVLNTASVLDNRYFPNESLQRQLSLSNSHIPYGFMTTLSRQHGSEVSRGGSLPRSTQTGR